MIDRTAARVLLLDPAGRVLLFRGHDPRSPDVGYWFTVGGGLDEGEDARDGGGARAARGDRARASTRRDLVGPVHHDVTEFPFDGRWYRQDAGLVRRCASTPSDWQVDTSGFEPIEQEMVETWRWWSADELRATDEAWYPAELVELVERVARESRTGAVLRRLAARAVSPCPATTSRIWRGSPAWP